jgi:hypothetical protein
MCRHNNSNRNIQRRNNHLLLNDWIADRHSNLLPIVFGHLCRPVSCRINFRVMSRLFCLYR